MTPAAANNLVLFGLLAVLAGVALFRFARPLARVSEQVDAIGSTTRADEVEPARWKVVLYRAVSVLLAVVGLMLAGQGALSL